MQIALMRLIPMEPKKRSTKKLYYSNFGLRVDPTVPESCFIFVVMDPVPFGGTLFLKVMLVTKIISKHLLNCQASNVMSLCLF